MAEEGTKRRWGHKQALRMGSTDRGRARAFGGRRKEQDWIRSVVGRGRSAGAAEWRPMDWMDGGRRRHKSCFSGKAGWAAKCTDKGAGPEGRGGGLLLIQCSCSFGNWARVRRCGHGGWEKAWCNARRAGGHELVHAKHLGGGWARPPFRRRAPPRCSGQRLSC